MLKKALTLVEVIFGHIRSIICNKFIKLFSYLFNNAKNMLV